MDIIAILMANLLFLALMVFAVRLERRVLRAEERSRHEASRYSERLFNLNRSVQTLQDSVDALHPATVTAADESAVLAERQFVQAIEEIMGYSVPKPSEAEVTK